VTHFDGAGHNFWISILFGLVRVCDKCYEQINDDDDDDDAANINPVMLTCST